jgi:AcrR family transcriptional regulator
MRADAQRNYDRILATAREAFREHGGGASLDDIAKRAGVGPGTLYRHFPTREALQEAVYRETTNEICERGRELARTAEPGVALDTWLELFIENCSSNRGLSRALMESTGKETEMFVATHVAIRAVVNMLIDRAEAAGEVRPGRVSTDVLRLVNGVALAVEAGGDKGMGGMLDIVLAGLRPR